MTNTRRILILLMIMLWVPLAQAKLFRNAYISFELPPDWNCNLEGTEWVCVNKFNKKAKEAIIILTAKAVGPTDSIAAYMAHLKTPRMLPSKGKPPKPSKIIHTRQQKISDHIWVDGMHLGSEIPSYYTRYLGTVKKQIAILVTFSAHKAHYTKYSGDFIRAIQSLKVLANKDLYGTGSKSSVTGRTNPKGPTHIGGIDGEGFASEDDFPDEDSSFMGENGRKVLGIAFLLLAIGFYLLMRGNKKRKRKRKKKKRKIKR